MKAAGELKDYKQIVNLRNQIDEETDVTDNHENINEDKGNDIKEDEGNDIKEDGGNDFDSIMKMKQRGFKRVNPQVKPIPIVSIGNIVKSKEIEYNCMECDYQGNTEYQLKKHQQLKHEPVTKTLCRICGEEFGEKWNLMVHRKQIHLTSVAQCKRNLEGKCYFSSTFCWWNHDNIPVQEFANGNIENNIARFHCYICDKVFNNKTDIMEHKKSDHRGSVKVCTNFLT